jgi:hypothetical protein
MAGLSLGGHMSRNLFCIYRARLLKNPSIGIKGFYQDVVQPLPHGKGGVHVGCLNGGLLPFLIRLTIYRLTSTTDFHVSEHHGSVLRWTTPSGP